MIRLHKVLRPAIFVHPLFTRRLSTSKEDLFVSILYQQDSLLDQKKKSLAIILAALEQERAFATQLQKLQDDKLATLEIELLRARERCNVRGAYEHTIDGLGRYLKAPYPASKKEISELLVKDPTFIELLTSESSSRSLQLRDTKQQALGLYSTLSTSRHGNNQNIIITHDLAPTTQAALAAIFQFGQKVGIIHFRWQVE
ncbi:hypothetical protein C8R44DRAFT_811761 [Mycena epipterygia]|nr:hypothetical protein C8R44DRAFT_811761 [Mycena epipterygia]